MKNQHSKHLLPLFASGFVSIQTLGLSLLFLSLMWACGNSDAKEGVKTPTAKFKVIQVETTPLSQTSQVKPIITSGVLNAKTEVNLSFKIGGIIQNMYVQEGQSVVAGQLLAQLEQAEIAAQVSQARNSLEKTKRDYKRAETLYKDTVSTLEQVQNANTAKEVAEAQLQIASYNQKHSAIYASTSGKVYKRMAEPQEIVSAGKPIFLIGSTAQAQVIRVGLSDRDVVKVRLGDEAKVYFDAYPEETFKAIVTEIAEVANAKTGTFEVELSVQNSNKLLKNGFVAKVELTPTQGESEYKIPQGALVSAERRTASIYIPNPQNQGVRKISVPIHEITNQYFTVKKSDLKGVKEVITAGAAYLNNDSKIAIKK